MNRRAADGVAAVAVITAGAFVAVSRSRRARDQREAQAPQDNGVSRRVVMLTSPHSGSAGQLGRARQALVSAGFEIMAEIPVTRREELTRWTAGPPGEVPLVVAAGGDGTVGAAADLLAHSHAVLAVLPLGTSNDFARSIGIPTDPIEAVKTLVTGKISTVDLGRLESDGQPARHFVHAATAGLNVSFARLATKASMRRRFGRLTYVAAAVMTLGKYTPFHCQITQDGQTSQLELVHLSVINAPIFGGFLGMRVLDGNLDDRILDVIAVEHLSPWRLVFAAMLPILRIKRPIAGVHTFHVSALEVHTSQPLDVALDGEILGALPAEFVVAGEALRVVTPYDFDDVDD